MSKSAKSVKQRQRYPKHPWRQASKMEEAKRKFRGEKIKPDVGPIRDDRPMPVKKRRYLYPFGKINPGQSFDVRGVSMSKLSAAIASHRKRHGGVFRTERQEDGSIVVWKDSD